MFPLMGPVQGGEDFMGYVHPGSAMFNRQSQGNYLSKLWGASDNPTSRRIGTMSCWMRLGEIANLSIDRCLFSGSINATNRTYILITSTGRLRLRHQDTGTTNVDISTNRLFRDPTAWYHILVNWDTTEAAAVDRIRVYVNGVEVTSFFAEIDPSLNKEFDFALANETTGVGQVTSPADNVFEGFIADFHFSDGTRYGPEEFGRFNPIHGEWIPKEVKGLTYGNNGFHLDFADENDLGNDVSGNNNDLTAQGTFGAANSFLDVPAKTYPIGNSVQSNSGHDWSEACLSGNELSATPSVGRHTHILPVGKWQFECTRTNPTNNFNVGLISESEQNANGATAGDSTNRGCSLSTTGDFRVNGTTVATLSAIPNNGVITYYVDNTDRTSVKVWIAVDGVQQGSGSPNPATGTDPLGTITNSHPFPKIINLITFAFSAQNGSYSLNFGQRRGGLVEPLAAGFKEINTGNFPTPTGPALLPDRFFDIIQYEGDGASSRTLTGLKFQPDMVWLKNLDANQSWRVAINMAGFSPSQSTPNNIRCDGTEVPTDFIDGNIEGFNADGFDVADGSTSGTAVNTNAQTYQAWCWKADPAAGLDIVRYTGDGVAGRTVAHNLGAVPQWIIVKRLDIGGTNWDTYFASYGRVPDPETDIVVLNSTNGAVDNIVGWNDMPPTDVVFSLGTSTAVNALDGEYVALLFADVPGFLKVASYEGNGDANGALIPTDFAPRHTYFKNLTSGNTNHNFQDNLLDEADYNQRDETIYVNQISAISVTTNAAVDFLANGIKRRDTLLDANGSGSFLASLSYAKVAGKFPRGR